MLNGCASPGAVGPVRILRGQLGPPSSKLGKHLRDFSQLARLQVRRQDRWVPVDPSDIRVAPRMWNNYRRVAQLVGVGIGNWVPFVSAMTEYNGCKALTIRVLSEPKYKPAAGLYLQIRGFVDLLLPGWGPISRMATQDWLDSMPARRKKPLAAAARRVEQKYWSERWGRFKAFIKTELLPGAQKDAVHSPIRSISDRVIQGPADEAHIIAGPVLKPATRRLKEIWSPDFNIFYASVSCDILSNWYNAKFRVGCVGVAADYSGFDNSHSQDSWGFVEHLYSLASLGIGDPRFRRVLKAWRAPMGAMRGKGWALKYVASFMNASGRDDTALANALLNGFAIFLSIVAAVENVPLSHVTRSMLGRARGWLWVAVCGDDSLVAVQRSVPLDFRDRVSRNIAHFGFCAEAEKLVVTRNPFEHVFLGMRPYPLKEGWAFGKTVGRALWKRGWKLDQLDSHLPAWLRGVCIAELKWNNHVPFYSDYLRRTLTLLGEGPVVQVVKDPNKPWTDGMHTPQYTEAAVRYVIDGYGLAPSAHETVLCELGSVSRLPWCLDSQVLNTIIDRDDL